MTDYPDWQTPQAHATAIFDTTVPLGRKPTGIFAASTALGGGQNHVLVNQAVVSQPSYQLYLNFELATNLGTIPFALIELNWFDSASGYSENTDWFWLPAGQLAFCSALVTGPCRGDEVTVTLFNLEPAVILNYNVSMTQTSHTYDQARFIQTDSSAVVGFTQPGKSAQAGILASSGPSITPTNHQDRLAAAWLGNAVLSVDNSNQPNGALVQVTDPGLITGGGMLYGTAASGVIAASNVGAGATNNATIALPAGPVNIRVTNTGSSGNIAPTVTLARVDH